MTRNDAHLRLGVIAILRFVALVAPALVVSEGLLWWADKALGAKIDGVPFLCAFALGAITMFTVGFRCTDYIQRRTDGTRKRALEALKIKD